MGQEPPTTPRSTFARIAAAVIALVAALALSLLIWSPATAQEAPPEVIEAVQADAAGVGALDVADVSVFRTEAVTWNNACIGAAEPGEVCAEVLTDGFVLWVQVNNDAMRYHTDADASEIRLAETGLVPGRALAADLPDGAEPRDQDEEPGVTTYTVQAGDTLWSIAQRFDVSVAALIEANDIEDVNAIAVGQELEIPNGGETDIPDDQVHVIQPGDTLWSIAQRYDTSVAALVDENDIENANMIVAGQRLVIPSDDDIVLAQTCTAPEFTIDYPQGWATNSGEVTETCRFFDAEPFTVPEATEFYRAINVRIDNVAFEQVLDGLGNDAVIIDGGPVMVDGQPGVRAHREFTDAALYPEGTEVYSYIVDLGDGTTLFAQTYSFEDFDFPRNQELLDEMIETLMFEPGNGIGNGNGNGNDFSAAPIDETDRAASGMLAEVRIGEHPGFDRVVFEFTEEANGMTELAEGVPSYRIQYVDSAVECGSGHPVHTEGSTMLEIDFPITFVYDPMTGEQTLDNLEFTTDHQVILEAVEICGFEGQSIWILGVTGEQPFRVHELSDPVRLVVDVATQ